ncbi:hypothetical protein Afil01_66430 [Actinorhabdospora filicis]|uniref:Uncharacterized protein n=1 Tax=Actinorhabdospora filicis TaxID=1785913 RepID=A0A9W6SW55_9ACTN|nr:hypothetical protein [Actinorhabdospora filicis]GLZ81836.1 hypothetical protein Afil01_66430 [Actinorhabdospora filicis]
MGDNDISHDPVEVDVFSLRTFALALRAEVEKNIMPSAITVNGALQNPNVHPSGLYAEGKTLGVDPRNEPSQHIVNYHTGAMAAGTKLMNDFGRGMASLANIAMAMAAAYRSTDELNAATEEDIRTKLNLPPDPPPGLRHRPEI